MSAAQGVGFFTLGVPGDGYDLPHPLLDFRVVLLIRRVLVRAFQVLREQSFDLAAASEDQITAALRSTIENNLRQSGEVRGFNRRTFEFVIRQGQWANYAGTVLTKTPDLFFKLRDDEGLRGRVVSELDGLFVEAKPVDSTHPAGSKYCDDGLIRFIRGDYAWGMQQAMMLAYTRDGRTIASHLLPAMSESARLASLKTVQLPRASTSAAAAAIAGMEAVCVSHHRRGFPWPHGKGEATEIAIYDLWPACG